MTLIRISTIIHAPIDVCFDLSRNIDLHQHSTRATNENAIAGRTSGLIELGESVTWPGTHFFIRQKLTSEITSLERPFSFEDRMVKGAFKSFNHKHIFEKIDDMTTMTDEFEYEVPYGLVGKWFDSLILENYVRKLLLKRNIIIKKVAESEMKNKYLSF